MNLLDTIAAAARKHTAPLDQRPAHAGADGGPPALGAVDPVNVADTGAGVSPITPPIEPRNIPAPRPVYPPAPPAVSTDPHYQPAGNKPMTATVQPAAGLTMQTFTMSGALEPVQIVPGSTVPRRITITITNTGDPTAFAGVYLCASKPRALLSAVDAIGIGASYLVLAQPVTLTLTTGAPVWAIFDTLRATEDCRLSVIIEPTAPAGCGCR